MNELIIEPQSLLKTPINVVIPYVEEISITINIQYSYSRQFNQIILNHKKTENESFISLTEIINELSEHVSLYNYQILFWNESNLNFIYIGRFPNIITNLNFDITNSFTISLKLRQIMRQRHFEGLGVKARAKERKICEVIKCVYKWRKLFYGYHNSNGKYIKMRLEDAADTIGISKKSLDDYLAQIKMGRDLGFDFKSNKFCKIGVLRTFLKKHSNCDQNK